MKEYWDLFDKDRKKVCTIERHEIIKEGLNRVVVHICIFNSKGELLIQQRHSSKGYLPNVWDISVGGGVKSGESACEAAHREVLEELGIDIDFSNERPFFTVNFTYGFDDFFMIENDVDLNQVRFVDNEVQAVKWATKADVLKMIDDKQFVPYYDSIVDMIFEMRNKRGCFKID